MVFTFMDCVVSYSVGLSLKSDEDDVLEIDRVIANTMPITTTKADKPNDHFLPTGTPRSAGLDFSPPKEPIHRLSTIPILSSVEPLTENGKRC